MVESGKLEPASPTKAAKKKSATSPGAAKKRPSMAKLGRILSFSKKGEKRQSSAALVAEEAVRAPSPTTAMALASTTQDEYDAAFAAMDQAEAAANAATEAIAQQRVDQAEAAAAAAVQAAAADEEARASVRESAASESAAWVDSINKMVASGWQEWTSPAKGGTAAAGEKARLDAEDPRRRAFAARRAELKAWVSQHQGLLLLALLLTVCALLSHSGVLSQAPPPPPPPPLKPHEKVFKGLVGLVKKQGDLAKKLPNLAKKLPGASKALLKATLRLAAALNPLQAA